MLSELQKAILRARYSRLTPQIAPERPKPIARIDPQQQAQQQLQQAEDRKIERDAAIVLVVALHYGIGIKEIISPQRTKDLVLARHVAMYLCKTLTDRPLFEIGCRIGNRDYTTVLYAVRKIAALRQVDSDFNQTLKELEAKLSNTDSTKKAR